MILLRFWLSSVDMAYDGGEEHDPDQPAPGPIVTEFKYFLALQAEIRVDIYDLVLQHEPSLFPDIEFDTKQGATDCRSRATN
ncbi:hypothetical protein VTJ49DRAFT_5327 [Mycothermus thermophilus]|uniref:Uncharacterized protein n=1 Tax=Humicola insolens TaxID=85995 RepID=A0ABR3V3F1_HUMIN